MADRARRDDYAQAREALDRLAGRGYQLRMPLARYLGDDLHELRFSCAGVDRRVTYWLPAPGRAVLLTTFHKQRDNERREVARARAALERCRAGGLDHITDAPAADRGQEMR